MTQDLHDINEDTCKEIGAAIRSGNCVLLAGLGFSLLTCTTENQLPQIYLRNLLERMLEWCNAKQLIAPQGSSYKLKDLFNQSSLYKAALQVEEQLVEQSDKQTCLKEALSQDRVPLKQIYDLLVQIPFRAYISTSYDTFIEDEYQRIKDPSKLTKFYRPSINKAIEAYQKKEPFILKLHGDIDEDNREQIILSDRASSSSAGNMISYPNDLRKVLSDSYTSILLIGFDKADPDLEELKRLINNQRAVKCWMLVPNGHLSLSEIEQLQKDDGITAIEYSGLAELKDFFKTLDRVSSTSRPTKIYISYSLADEAMKEKLSKHLKVMSFPGLNVEWLEGDIGAGEEKEPEILNRLKTADIILVLVSVEYLFSLKEVADGNNAISKSEIELEMTNAVQRHTNGKARVIPVILRPCEWKDTEFFAKLQVLPKAKKGDSIKAVSSWPRPDEVYLEIARAIKTAILDWATKH
jgi:hypothetical protein